MSKGPMSDMVECRLKSSLTRRMMERMIAIQRRRCSLTLALEAEEADSHSPEEGSLILPAKIETREDGITVPEERLHLSPF